MPSASIRAKKAGKKAWERHPRIGSKAIVSGDFGESLVAYLFRKEGIEVVRAKTVGFDLFAIDLTGDILPKNEIIGISVKARITKSSPTIPVGSSKIQESMKTWKISAWIGIVASGGDESFVVFVFPFNELRRLRGKSKRLDVVSVAELYKASDSGRFRVKRLL